LFLHGVEPAADQPPEVDLPVRDERGRVVAMRTPARRYVLTYLVTARGRDVAEEHRTLGLVLAAHAATDVLTGPLLTGQLAELDVPVPIEVGPASPDTVWAALGVPARLALVLRVTAAVPPMQRTDFALVRTVDLAVEHRRSP
jgi:hypothetical protein